MKFGVAVIPRVSDRKLLGGPVGTPIEIIAMLREHEVTGLSGVSLLPAMVEARRSLSDFAEKMISRY